MDRLMEPEEVKEIKQLVDSVTRGYLEENPNYFESQQYHNLRTGLCKLKGK